MTLKLGERIPVISTSYTPIADGGAGVNPLSTYQYQDIGVNIDMTPRVTLRATSSLDLTLDDSSRRHGQFGGRQSRADRSGSAR